MDECQRGIAILLKTLPLKYRDISTIRNKLWIWQVMYIIICWSNLW